MTYVYVQFYNPKLREVFSTLCLLHSTMYRVLYERSNCRILFAEYFDENTICIDFSFMILKSRELFHNLCMLGSAI